MSNLKYIGKNILNHDLVLKKGNVSGSANSTGSFGLVEVNGKELNPSGILRDQVLKFNGTHFVAANFDDTFVFTIADFDMNDSTTPQ